MSTFNHLKAYLIERVRQGLKRALTQPRLAAVTRKLVIDRKYRLNIGHPERVVILLAGCGGTGSFAAHILAQLACWAKTANIDMRLYFIDPDIVEQRNLVRQNFCPTELGAPKAVTLAWRFSAAFGLAITPVVKRFSADMLRRYAPRYATGGTLTIVVGAVDNVQARREIAQAVTERLGYLPPGNHLFWLDAGNERANGQILLGNSLEPEPLLSPLGYCTGLPLPHLQEPTLLMDRARPPDADGLSCAELSGLDEQSAMINRLMATWVGVYLYRLLQSRDLDMMATFTSLDGVSRSTFITGGRTVFPRKVGLTTAPPAEEEDVETEGDTDCPECGGEIIEGQDEVYGVLVSIRFCAHCHWRVELCPACGANIDEEELALDSGETGLGLTCRRCDWTAPYPPEHQPEAEPRPPTD